MVRACLNHAAYQRKVREEVAHLPAPIGQRLPEWGKVLHLCWFADLDPLLPLLCRRYSPEGRPAHDPGCMLRCLLLMTAEHCRRPTVWFRRLRREPVLAIATGFGPDDLPRVATFYDFLHRFYPGPRHRYALRRPAARRLRATADKKLPPARRGLLKRLVQHLLATAGRPHRPGQVWNELLATTVAGSVARGRIPHPDHLTVASDGTALDSGCYSHGKKTCTCPKVSRCDHPRRYTDAGALNGYDSYRHRWFVGRFLNTLVEAESGHGLPLWLSLGPANRHDSLSGALVLHHACAHYAHTGLRFRAGLFDKAYEGEPFLRLCYHHRIDPVVARTQRAKLKPKIARRLARDGVHLDADGTPVCTAGLRMHSRGHSKPHVWSWVCPRGGDCPTPCPFAHRSLCLNALADPRALTPSSSATPARKRLFKRRTACERWHSWLDLCEVQNARHRCDALWFGRSALAAIVWHLRTWAGTCPPHWTRDTLLTAT